MYVLIKYRVNIILAAAFLFTLTGAEVAVSNKLVDHGSEIVHVAGGYAFTEGPTANSKGDVFFTDSHRDHILQLPVNGELSTFRKPSGGAVGLFFDKNDNLLVCAGRDKKLVSIDPEGETKVLADSFNGLPLNRPNDAFSHPEVGIFFTDPVGRRDTASVSRVYHLTPDHKTLTAPITDMLYPNGVLVTEDGKTLYISDWNAKEVYSFAIGEEGALSDRKVFANEECDGMTLDEHGNVYLACSAGVMVYTPEGKKIDVIEVPEPASNVCFGGADRKTLFITAKSSLYSLKMNVRGGY